MPIVNIYLKNDDVLNTPISSASLGIYSSTSVFVTQGVTSSLGLVSFSLPTSGSPYHVYVYKQGVSLVQPQLLNVTNNVTITYELIAHEKSLPESIDPELIRVSGYIYNGEGKGKKNVDLNLYHEYTQLNGNTVISSTPTNFTSDERGYFQFDLYRGMRYCFPYMTERSLVDVRTPDRPAIKITELLFAVPTNLEIDPTSYSVPYGQSIQFPYMLTWSDYSTDRGFCDTWGEVVWSVNNQNVTFAPGKDTITLTGLQRGTSIITFERKFKNCLHWKNPPPFVSPSLTITIS